jgi:nucleoside-diphosphate-sugar epimerase
MRVLVTGATGFLGGAVARRLHAAGHEVLATGRSPVRGAALAQTGPRFVAADLTNREGAEALCRDQDWIVHCAALSSPWGAYPLFHDANVVATSNLVGAASRAGVGRFVHISTPSLYMGGGSRFDVREDDPLPAPVNAYAATKREAEKVVRAAREAGLRSVILRPRALFGPGDTTLFPRLLRALESNRLPVIGDGRNLVDLTYIDNVVDSVELACAAPEQALDQVYNITNGEPIRLWPLIGELAESLGLARPSRHVSRPVAMAVATLMEAAARVMGAKREPLLTRYSVQVLADSMTLNLDRARALLGYVPKVTVRDGLHRFVSSLQVSS